MSPSKPIIVVLSLFAILGIAAGLEYYHLRSSFMAPADDSSASAQAVPVTVEAPATPVAVEAPAAPVNAEPAASPASAPRVVAVPTPPAPRHSAPAPTPAAPRAVAAKPAAPAHASTPAPSPAPLPAPTKVAAVQEKIIPFGFGGALQDEGLPAPWQSRVIVGKLQIDLPDEPQSPGQKMLHLQSQKAHYVLYCPTGFDPAEFPIVSWKWMVKTLPENGDVRVHNPIPIIGENRNDSAVRVMIGFEGNNVLCYLWDSNAPVGTEEPEPSPVATIRSQVVDSGSAHLNEWISHRVNIVDDYKRRYEADPGKVLGIGIETNSNHTRAIGDAYVAQITARQH